jgi:hypothetical protein
VRNIADNMFSRDGILAFAKAIGFPDEPIRLPHDDSIELLGQRGTLRCYLINCEVDHHTLTRIARRLRCDYAAELQLFLFATTDYARIAVATFAGDELAVLFLERGRVHASDVDALAELVPQNGECGVQLALRHARALDRMRVTTRFFDDFRAQRSVVSEAWRGILPRLTSERNQLALLLLSRLMFLYFLQRRGFLCGDQDYFRNLLRAHFTTAPRVSFYRGVLRPLFFGVLNRRPERRTLRAAALGPLPYLNGGLFERHHLERRFPNLDLADPVARAVFQHLLERYRFTASEGTRDLAVDPEMLGRVFEGLMEESTRHSTGTFYTPAHVVERIVSSAFSTHLAGYSITQQSRVLREVRVLDPACGSGAFLLSALSDISRRRGDIEQAAVTALKRDVVARNLHGVDLQHDAALLCALRLWLCLIPDSPVAQVQPLPNLDRRIRQGDALIDPLDIAADTVANAEVRAARRALQPLVERYTVCDPEERQGVHRLVTRRERQLARAWLAALRQRIRYEAGELRAVASERDLFGEVPATATAAREQLSVLDRRAVELKRLHRSLRDNGAQPFFSFNVHFADAQRTGFDIILCNPPWVRSHNWPKNITPGIRKRFRVCSEGGQVDLALVFLERAITLLAPAGTLAIILPAKFLRSASAGAGREMVLRELHVLSIEDHSLDQRSIFGADAFAAIMIARKKMEAAAPPVHVTMVRRKCPPLTFTLASERLPFDSQHQSSPWLLVPAAVHAVMQQMCAFGITVGSLFKIRRGVVTGANAVMIVKSATGKLGDLAHITTEGLHDALIEDRVICPLVRGGDIDSWCVDVRDKVIFCHDHQTGAYVPPPKRTKRFLDEHAALLAGSEARGRLGGVQHVDVDSLRPKLAWHDLANTLKAVVLPPRASCLGTSRPLIPLNTVYFIPLDDADAHLLAACFNSLPLRVFARALAERAKDAHFRFFACTVSQLPLPRGWRVAASLRDISVRAHNERTITADAQHELDSVIARMFGLSAAQLQALRHFDDWLEGRS